MQNHKCRFCIHRRQCLYASIDQISKKGDLIQTMNISLYYKHGQSQNYFFSRPINQILRKEKHTIYAKVEDYKILDSQEEYLKQFYYMPNCQLQLKQLIQYYKFSIDHPMLYFLELKAIILKYLSSRSQVEYHWAINQIEKEAQREGGMSPKKSKKKSTPLVKQELSFFLKELNDTQKSTTILQLLKNVEADRAIEKDWQKQFTQSLIEQDLTKAMQFSTFLQQKELQKPKESTIKVNTTSKTVYLGNIKKQQNLQIGTPRKASNLISNNFSNGCSVHNAQSIVNTQIQNSQVNQLNQNNGLQTTISNNKMVTQNFHFFNHNLNHQTQASNSQNNVNHNFITKTSIVNSSNGNIFKPQTIYKMQPLRLMEVPKLKIKLNHQDPKSERKYDRVRENRIDCLTQRIKTQLDESNTARLSVNPKTVVIKRRQNFQH
ncbi:unnamed protein product [Paramecium sonneborni]|uniref:Uncharacterized protein n=1 Tax=Paramecium sonneborni TaxID=65129 RepID=A0A8S1Q4T6_9CILI|nr:unnamed protein product [Paramecium sonneborni]